MGCVVFFIGGWKVITGLFCLRGGQRKLILRQAQDDGIFCVNFLSGVWLAGGERFLWPAATRTTSCPGHPKSKRQGVQWSKGISPLKAEDSGIFYRIFFGGRKLAENCS
jgi:hypothetical protein